MAHLEESLGSSAAVENLKVDFKSIIDVERGTKWNRETVVSHLLHDSNWVSGRGKNDARRDVHCSWP